MSDEEYEYDYGSDEEYQYGSDGGGEEAQDDLIEIENAFYEGDDCRQEEPKKALEMFEKVVKLEVERGPEVKWRFKALEHLAALHFRLGAYDKMLQRYREMLKYVGDVTRNECTESINSVLDLVSSSTDLSWVAQMYEVTAEALQTAKNERMWFQTFIKLAKVYMAAHDYAGVDRTINKLHGSCKTATGQDDSAKGTQLLEVYGLVVTMCNATKNDARMREVYPKIMALNAAVEDPRVMGPIREEGGKMYMALEQWSTAYDEFYEAFRNYQEAGNSRARDCLKYVVLANMLALSDINPFAAREAKVYQDDKEVAAMSNLRLAYESNDLPRFERTIRDKANNINGDAFIMSNIDSLRRRMREQVLLNMVRPYHKITMTFMAQELNLTAQNVESLLIDMILDRRIRGKIDQLNGYLWLEESSTSLATKKHQSVERWSDVLDGLSAIISNKHIAV